MLLKDKVILVTGAAGGIGRGIAEVCHREGAHVVIADLHDPHASRAASEIGQRAVGVGGNVCDRADRRRLMIRGL